MDFQQKISIEDIVKPDEVAILNLNYSAENFENCFSKMEFTMAMDYLSWAIPEFNIPSIFTRLIRDPDEPEFLKEYRNQKLHNRSAHSAPKSSLDSKFLNEFRKHLPGNDSMIVDVSREDAFFGSNLYAELKKLGKRTVMVTGFYTEVDVYITAIEATMNGFMSVVVSDATSTFSERVFFQSLDIISQVVDVIDTRDLEKIWGAE